MFIEKISTSRREDNIAVFVVRFVLQEGRVDVVCAAATILDYAAFQRHVLEQTGRVFICDVAEGREPALANHFWKIELCLLTDIEARKAAEAAKHN